MVRNKGSIAVRKTRICPQCLCEVKYFNNDEDFSWDMHRQESTHMNSSRHKSSLKMSLKTETTVKNMKYWFISINHLQKRANELEKLADNQKSKHEQIEKIIKSVTNVFSKVYPGKVIVQPFGSRITGLTTKDTGDLDIFVNTSGNANCLIDSPEIEKFYLRKIGNYMKDEDKDVWYNVIEVLTCRTPIIKVLHLNTKMQCDITVMNAFGIINTKLMSMYLRNIPILRQMLLLVREWVIECNFVNDINNYALSMMVLFYLQQQDYAPPVYIFEFDYSGSRTKISGYDCINYDEVLFDWNTIKNTSNVKLNEIMHGFFSYYANFDYKTNILCPLLGKPIKKNLFANNGKKLPPEMYTYVVKVKNRGEMFNVNHKSINIQDPLDLSHNLTKSASQDFLWDFMDMCESSKQALESISKQNTTV